MKYLNDNGYLILYQNAPNCKDLTYYIEIKLLEKGTNYFVNKKNKSIGSKREWIRTYIPITLSVVSIIISIIALLVAQFN